MRHGAVRQLDRFESYGVGYPLKRGAEPEKIDWRSHPREAFLFWSARKRFEYRCYWAGFSFPANYLVIIPSPQVSMSKQKRANVVWERSRCFLPRAHRIS